MPDFLVNYILSYGYLAIFCAVLIQELGVPGVPNEVVLFTSGYMAHEAGLSYPLIVLLVIVADIAGSFSLFMLCFHFGRKCATVLPRRWLLSPRKMVRFRSRLKQRKGRTIFIAKITPFVRGYLPVAAGILRLQPRMYSRSISQAALVWSGGWFTAGWLLLSWKAFV